MANVLSQTYGRFLCRWWFGDKRAAAAAIRDQRLKKEEEVWMSRTSSLLVAKSQECNKGEEDERKISVSVLAPPTLTLNTDHELNSSWRS